VYDSASDFSGSLAMVRQGSYPNYKYGFVDTEGNVAVSPIYDAIQNFSEGLAWVQQDGKWGILQVSDIPAPTIKITTQPATTTSLTAGGITGSLTVAASASDGAALTYQWYSNTGAVNTGGTAIPGATGAAFTIPVGLTEGTYYYFCEVSAANYAVSVRSNAATVVISHAGTQPPPPGGGTGGGGGSLPQATIPAGNGSVSVSYTAAGGTATLDLPASKVTEIIGKPQNGAAVLDLSKVSGVSGAALPKSALSQFAGAGLGVSVKLPQGTVTLDAKAAKDIAAQAGDANVTISLKAADQSSLTAEQRAAIKPGDLVFNVSVSSGAQAIHNFDGSISVTVSYNGPLPTAIWYLNDAGVLEQMDSVYDPVTKTITFTTSHLSLYVAGQGANPFKDVSQGDWFYDAAMCLYSSNLMVGMSDDTFGPDTELSRAMVATILYRQAGSPDAGSLANPFKDVGEGAWYADAVKWAYANGIVLGYGDGRFGVSDPVTNEQLAALIYRMEQASGLVPPSVGGAAIPDAGSVSAWAQEAVSALSEQGVLSQIPDLGFDPGAPAIRANVASMLYMYLTSI